MARRRVRLFNQPHTVDGTDEARADEATVARDRSQLYNQLALLFVALTLVLIVYIGVTLISPNHPLNPLPPVTEAVAITPLPTSTPTETPTPTSTSRPTNTPTVTRAPTRTPAATETVEPSSGTSAPVPTPTSTAVVTPAPFAYEYELIYQRAQLYGVNWAGIAGVVFGLDKAYQPNIDVHAWGDAPLGADGQTWPSGTAPQYGPSGFEFKLGNRPAFGKWRVQLVDADGAPLSDVVEIEMQGDPLSNLAYLIFRQVR